MDNNKLYLKGYQRKLSELVYIQRVWNMSWLTPGHMRYLLHQKADLGEVHTFSHICKPLRILFIYQKTFLLMRKFH